MRTFIIILCILAAAVAGVAIYLVVTTPDDAPPLRFPLTEAQQQLLAAVPRDAEAYALVPAPVVLLRRLEANPVTRDAVNRWKREQPLPPAAMLGRADAVIWREGKNTSYAVRFDPVRAIIVRTWSAFASADVEWAGRTMIVDAAPRTDIAATPPELPLAQQLPDGDVFVVQRQGSRGAFPPIGRPALTSASVSANEIVMTSIAPFADPPPAAARRGSHALLPRSALLSVAFTEPPRLLGDLDRLLGADIDALVGDGATLAIYGVDTGTLLPRPFATIVVPANDRSRAAAARYERVISMVGEKVERNGQLVVAFDRRSAGQYLDDATAPMPWPGNLWSLRLDPARLMPVLRRVGDNPALRFATPRLHRGARDLRRWIGPLENARTVEAAASAADGFDQLRVRVASK